MSMPFEDRYIIYQSDDFTDGIEVNRFTIFFFLSIFYLLEFKLLTVLDYIYLYLGYRVKQIAVMNETQFPPNAFRGSSKILLPGSTAETGSWTGWFFLDLEDGFTVGFAVPVEKISSVRSEQKADISKYL